MNVRYLSLIVTLAVVIVGCSGGAPTPQGNQTTPSPDGSPASPETPLTGVLAKIQDTGELKVAGMPYIPFMIGHPDGTFTGIEPDLFQQLADRLSTDLGQEVSLVFVPDSFGTAVAGLQTEKFYLVPSLNATPARQEVIDFSEGLLQNQMTFYLRSDYADQPESIQDLNDAKYTIIVNLGGSGDEAVTRELPNADIKRIPNANSEVRLGEVLSGRSDVTFADYPTEVAKIKARYGDEIRFVTEDPSEMLNPVTQAWGLPKGDSAWKAYVDAFLQEVIESGELDRLKEQWLSPEVLTQTPAP